MRKHLGLKFFASFFLASLMAACGGGGLGDPDATGGTTGSTTGGDTVASGVPATIVLASAKSSLVANGTSTTALVAVLTDTTGVPMAGRTIEFETSAGSLGQVGGTFTSPLSATTNSAGAATVLLKSATVLGPATVTATDQLSGISSDVAVQFIAGAASQVTLDLTPAVVAPNQPTTATITVLDADGNPVTGKAVTIRQSPAGSGTVGPGVLVTDDAGTITTTFTPNKTVNLTARTSEGILSTAQTLTVDPTVAVVGDLTLTTIVDSVAADGTTQARVRANVKNDVGNVIPGLDVLFSTTGGNVSPANGGAGTTVATNSSGNADFAFTSAAPGIVSVTAATGGFTASKDVTFTGTAAVSTISLIASSPELQSGATTVAQGVTITALLKDSGNNVIPGAKVNFTTARKTGTTCGLGGAITKTTTQAGVAPGTTDINGTAAAVLTTGGDAQNQVITVTVTSGLQRQDIDINVTGTQLQIAGAANLGLGGSSQYTVSLKDSSGAGIANKAVTLSKLLAGNALSATNLTTDANGQAKFTYTGTNGGTDIISASTASSCNTATQNVIISTQALAFLVAPTSATQSATTAAFTVAALNGTQDINLGTTAAAAIYSTGNSVRVRNAGATEEFLGTVTAVTGSTVTVRTDTIVSGAAGDSMASGSTMTVQNGEVVIGAQDSSTETNALAQTVRLRLTGGTVAAQPITFTTTRGTLSASTVNTDANGIATVRISQATTAPGTGGGVLTATGPGGISATLNFSIVSHTAETITLQATPNNVPTTRTSIVTATVRDLDRNPVKGETVAFTLVDSSGGSLSASSAVTNAEGVATVTYTASSSSSSRDGVKITGKQTTGTLDSDTVTLTVGGQALRIVLGTGNSIVELTPTRYSYPYSVSVTDSAGSPVANAPVSLLVQSLAYQKGILKCGDDDATKPWKPYYYQFDPPATPNTLLPGYNPSLIGASLATVSPPAPLFAGTTACANEDANFNGELEAGEDLNGDGILQPGNVVTVIGPPSGATDASGVANFSLEYPQDHAQWVQVRVTAVVSVGGTESIEAATFVLRVLSDDINDCAKDPPGIQSPYGVSIDCASFK